MTSSKVGNVSLILKEIENQFGRHGLEPIHGETSNAFFKMEGFCPTGSIKVKTALSMIQKKMEQGVLIPSSMVVDASAGNFGVGLSWVCNRLGFGCNIIYPSTASELKAGLIKENSAEISYFERNPKKQEESFEEVLNYASHLPGAVRVDQMKDPANPLAHYKWTGPEIWKASSAEVTHVFCAIGTGGTISGVGRFLKMKNPAVQIIGVDVVGSIYGAQRNDCDKEYDSKILSHKIEGVGDVVVSKVFDSEVVDQIVVTEDNEGIHHWGELKNKGYAVGMSTGLVYAGFKKFEKAYGFRKNDFPVLLSADSSRLYVSK